MRPLPSHPRVAGPAGIVPALAVAAGILLAGATAAAAQEPPWRGVQAVSAPGEVAEGLRVTAAPNGRALAVWASARSGGSMLRAATREPGGRWTEPIDLGPGLGVGAKSMAINSAGDAAIVWFTRPGGLKMALRPGSTGAWRAAEPIMDEPASTAVGIEESGAMVLLAAPQFARVLALERAPGAGTFGKLS